MNQFLFGMVTSKQITSMFNESYFLSLLDIKPFLTNLVKPPLCLSLSLLTLISSLLIFNSTFGKLSWSLVSLKNVIGVGSITFFRWQLLYTFFHPEQYIFMKGVLVFLKSVYCFWSFWLFVFRKMIYFITTNCKTVFMIRMIVVVIFRNLTI